VHQPAQLIPLVHAAKLNPVTHPDRDTLGQIEIVGDQQRIAILHSQDDTLMPRAVIVVAQQSADESRILNPVTGIAFLIAATDLLTTPR